MTKSKYMEALQKKLEKFSKELQEDILEDYRQHFAEGELQGKTDEEIVEELGNIEDMIMELPQKELEEEIRQQMPDGKNIVVGTNAEQGNGGCGQAEEENSGNREGKEFFSYAGDYAEMVLEAEEADILLENSEDEQIHVEYVNGSPDGGIYEYYQYEENGVFYGGIRCGRRGEEKSGDGRGKPWKTTLFGKTIISYSLNGCDRRELLLAVKVPGRVPKVSAKTSTGDIRGTGLVQSGLQFTSASGDIRLSGADSANIKIQASSGDMEIRDTVCGDRMEIKVSSGDIKMMRMRLNQTEIKCASGDVSLEDVKCSGILALEGSSGNISAVNVEAKEMNMQAASGDVSIADTEFETGNILAHSGDVIVSGCRFKTGSIASDQGDIVMNGMEFETGNFLSRGGDMAAGRFRFTTGSFASDQGDVGVSDMEFETGNFTAGSGDIAGYNMKGTFAGVFTKQGDISMRDDGKGRCCRMYQCKTESGDIVVASDAEIYECTARSGDIEILASGSVRKITAKSLIGDIKADAKGSPESVSLKSENGDVSLKLEETQGMEATVRTGWGDAEIVWEGNKKEVNKGTYIYGDGTSKVDACSKRGDVSVCGRC